MSNCKYCGNESYDRPFCPECGKKYFGFDEPITIKSTQKNKSTIQIRKTESKNKTNDIIVKQNNNDSYFDNNELKKYNIKNDPNLPKATHQEARIYQCKNGNKVRSKSEREISDFLTEHQIKHEYEKPIRINYYQYIHPDFFIPGYITHTGKIFKNIYLEHFGGPKTNNSEEIKKYNDKAKYKLNIYKELGLTVLCTTEKDMIDPNTTLLQKLLTIKENKINY